MAEKKKQKLKMSDIAKLAHVSRSAVSLVLNGKPGVSEETRKKVFEIIDKEGYEPLRKRRKGGVRLLANINLIIVSDKSGVVSRNYRSLPFFDTLVSQLTKNVDGFGGHVEIDVLSLQNLENDLKKLLSNDEVTDAIVLSTDLDQKGVKLINDKIRHVVFIDTYFDDIEADFVTMDNFQGAYTAAKYIAEQGYKVVGYAASNKLIANFLYRRRGFRAGLAEAAIKVKAEHVYNLNPVQLMPTSDLSNINLTGLPEAIFCEDDYMALRLIKEFTKHGISVPKDVAVMGFDDVYEGQIITPELSTIHVPINQMVTQAIYQLQSQASTADWAPQKCLVSTHLIKRASL